MLNRDLNTVSVQATAREPLMYSRGAIMRRVTYLLFIVTALQTTKLLFLPDLSRTNISLHILNSMLHMGGFMLCIWAFKHKRFELGKWLLQIFFISFITTAGFLWQLDMALQYFYLLALFVTGFMFSERETTFFVILCVVYIGLFLLFQHLHTAAAALSSYATLTMVNSLVLALSCLGCAWVVRKMTLSNWKVAQNYTQSQSDVIYKVFPEHIAGKLISLHNKQHSSSQDLMYKAPMTVVFIDIVNSTRYMKKFGDTATLNLISNIFSEFDDAIKQMDCLRIKTNGDQYIFVSELQNEHQAARVCKSLRLIQTLHLLFNQYADSTSLKLRCGVATGEVSAGVVNIKSPSFDVWGRSVVEASRLEQSCTPMHVHCDKRTFELAQDRFIFSVPTVWNFKGLGETVTYQMTLE
jgi:class 3 adenylate cyclase